MSTTTTSKSASAAQFVFSPPNSFDFQNPSSWERWLQRFERYRIVSRLNLQPPETQVATLIYCLGEDAEDIISTSSLSQYDQKDYEKVKSMFQDHFTKKRNIIYERVKFNLRSQRENESIEAFVTDLLKLGEHCNYGNLLEEVIRDRIVIGIRDKQLSELLQLDAELTLEKAINQCRQKEEIIPQQNDIESEAEIIRVKDEPYDEEGYIFSGIKEEVLGKSETFLSKTGKTSLRDIITAYRTVTQTTPTIPSTPSTPPTPSTLPTPSTASTLKKNSEWAKAEEISPTIPIPTTIQQGTSVYHPTPVSISPFEKNITKNGKIRPFQSIRPISSASNYNRVITCPDCHERQVVSFWRLYLYDTYFFLCEACLIMLRVSRTHNNTLVVVKCTSRRY